MRDETPVKDALIFLGNATVWLAVIAVIIAQILSHAKWISLVWRLFWEN